MRKTEAIVTPPIPAEMPMIALEERSLGSSVEAAVVASLPPRVSAGAIGDVADGMREPPLEPPETMEATSDEADDSWPDEVGCASEEAVVVIAVVVLTSE